MAGAPQDNPHSDGRTGKATAGRRAWKRWGVVGILALLVGVSVAVSERMREQRILRGAHAKGSFGQNASENDSLRDEKRRNVNAVMLAATLRDLRLVTVRMDHAVTATAVTESWRGDVQANVSAMATTLFGVDLSRLRDEDIRVNALTGTVTVRLPLPERIATEIQTPADEQAIDVRVGWARLRDVAGEYYLGQARARLHEAARAQLLSPSQRMEVERLTREQVAKLVRALGAGGIETGDEVRVEFVDSERVIGGAGDAGGGESPRKDEAGDKSKPAQVDGGRR